MGRRGLAYASAGACCRRNCLGRVRGGRGGGGGDVPGAGGSVFGDKADFERLYTGGEGEARRRIPQRSECLGHGGRHRGGTGGSVE